MASLTLTAATTVAALKSEFNSAFGATLRVYDGGKVADDSLTLGELGLSADGPFECRSSLTVDSFIERMKSEHNLKVKVYTCDGWVAVLGGLTLESAGKVKKNAVKADMESMIAYQRTGESPSDEYSVIPGSSTEAASAPAAKPKAEAPKAEKKDDEPQVKASKADIAGARVRVYGKAQNRTALGIMHAYMVMYPQAKLEDLKKAFPKELNPDSGVKENFVFVEEKGATGDWNGFFKAEDELLKMGDGKKVSVVSMWTKPSFERLVAWARQYGIVVADFEKAAGGGQKGGFRLEYLNGYVPPKPKKGIAWWVWLLIAALIVLLCLLLFGRKKAEPQIVEVEKVVVVHDTLYVKQIAEIEDHYNAATFVAGKADLSDDAKFVLHDLAKVMNDNPKIRLRLEGHTSAEGDAAFNQRLSEARAQAAVDFMVGHEGIDASRLEAIGKGSSEPKNPADPTAPENRRTEFIVIE